MYINTAYFTPPDALLCRRGPDPTPLTSDNRQLSELGLLTTELSCSMETKEVIPRFPTDHRDFVLHFL